MDPPNPRFNVVDIEDEVMFHKCLHNFIISLSGLDFVDNIEPGVIGTQGFFLFGPLMNVKQMSLDFGVQPLRVKTVFQNNGGIAIFWTHAHMLIFNMF